MPDVKTFEVYYGQTDRTRGYLSYTITTYDDKVAIQVISLLDFITYSKSGYRLNSLINGEVVATKTGYAPEAYSDWKTCIKTDSYTQEFAREFSEYTVQIGSNYDGEVVGGYNAGGKDGSTTITITIPAKTPCCYVKINGAYAEGQCFIKDNGSWKKGVPWIKQNGVWKRGGA